MCVPWHAQITQNKSFANSLQYLKKEVNDFKISQFPQFQNQLYSSYIVITLQNLKILLSLLLLLLNPT